MQALFEQASADRQLMGDLASAENGIGTVHDRRFEYGPAESSFGRAAALRERLAAGPKPGASDRASLALTLSNFGNTKARNGRQNEGLRDIHRAITLLERGNTRRAR